MSEQLSAEVRKSNWEFLIHKFIQSTAHKAVAEKLNSASSTDLGRLLRDHRTEYIVDIREIEFRRLADEWLGQAARLYLAWICGYVPDPANQSEAGMLSGMLANAAVRAYYEQYYPVALPWLFRLHLERAVTVPSETSVEGAGAFERCSILHERIREDQDLSQFLDFLDGFSYGSTGSRIDLDAVVDSFQNPNRIAEAFARSAGQITPLDRGIVGLVRFLTFCRDLDDLLQRCWNMPLVQSGLWFHYGYWFNEYRMDAAAKALQAIDKIVAAAGSKDWEQLSTAVAERAKWMEALRRLTNGNCAKPLLDYLQSRAKSYGELSSGDGGPSDWIHRFRKYAEPAAIEQPRMTVAEFAPAVSASSDGQIPVPALTRNVLVAVDRMAPAIYEAWRRSLPEQQWGGKLDKQFDQLDYEAKVYNIAAALRIPWILSLIGCALAPGPPVLEEEQAVVDLIDGNIEYLAEAEHRGWMEQRLAVGWTYAEHRDDQARKHNCLIAYALLPESEKERDRRTIRQYPAYARLAGLRIVLSSGETP